MRPQKLQVFVEYLPDKQFAEALLHDYDVEVVQGMSTSGAVSLAMASLFERPDRPVAVLLRARTENPREVNELRGALKRLLAQSYPENWCAAVAVPRLDAWAGTDPRIKQDFESFQNGQATYTDLASRMVELTRTQPFDATELRKTNADFRNLVEFIEKHTQQAPVTDQTLSV